MDLVKTKVWAIYYF